MVFNGFGEKKRGLHLKVHLHQRHHPKKSLPLKQGGRSKTCLQGWRSAPLALYQLPRAPLACCAPIPLAAANLTGAPLPPPSSPHTWEGPFQVTSCDPGVR